MNGRIELSGAEMMIAAYVGSARQWWAVKEGRPDTFGFDGTDGLAKHIAGAAGELAVAKHTDRYWTPSVNTYKNGGDVGNDQVRTRSKHEYELIVRPGDPDDAMFWLVTGVAPNLWVRGRILGSDAKRQEWSQNHGARPPAFFVPHSALLPPSDTAPTLERGATPPQEPTHSLF